MDGDTNTSWVMRFGAMQPARVRAGDRGHRIPGVKEHGEGQKARFPQSRPRRYRIVEQGTHDELLRHGGRYERLWRHQAGGFLAPDIVATETETELLEEPPVDELRSETSPSLLPTTRRWRREPENLTTRRRRHKCSLEARGNEGITTKSRRHEEGQKSENRSCRLVGLGS